MSLLLAVSLTAGVLGGLVGATTDLPAIPVAFVSAGVSALVTILSGKIVVPTFAYNREKDRADRLEVLLLDKVMPAWTEGIKATADVLDYLKSRRQ